MPAVFRWNVARREQLGRLVDVEPPPLPAKLVDTTPDRGAFVDELRRCCAQVISAAGDSRLVFVGRSPESLYDYLAGAFAGTSWSDRLVMLNVSFLRCDGHWTGLEPAPRAAVAEQFRELGLDPLGIASSRRPIALIDLICGGGTFESLTTLLTTWAGSIDVDDRAVYDRLRIVGITRYYPPRIAPTSWKCMDWAKRFRSRALKGISVPDWFWTYLGDDQPKVSRSNPSWCWADPTMSAPPREPAHAQAARDAAALYQHACTRAERDALAATLVDFPSIRHAWCRELAGELRSVTRPKRVERGLGSKWRVPSRNRNARR